ncbi:MAG: hypothetical protein K2N26_00970 [Oscillospiraceae bacterium]|nr:hypothetical protein [Oscillospiraceae bacterium]
MDSLFDGSYAVQSGEPQNYKGKLLIIRAESLKEEFRTPENQLFLASGGFGCDPTASGRKVCGKFLSDGEETHFYRSDFGGILSDEHTPQWAKEKMEQLASQSEEQKTASENNINLNM